MSTELKAVQSTTSENEIFMTRFSGGMTRGVCVQLTRHVRAGRFNSIQLTKQEALSTAAALIEFATDTREEA